MSDESTKKPDQPPRNERTDKIDDLRPEDISAQDADRVKGGMGWTKVAK